MTYKAMKFRIKDESHSKEVQEKLFEQGYYWAYNESVPLYTYKKFLSTDANDRRITYSEDENYFEIQNQREEYVLCDGQFYPASEQSVSEGDAQIAGKPVKSDGGSSSYYQVIITNKSGESINCEIGDIIRATLGNDFDLGNSYKALRRMFLASQGAGKSGTSVQYDTNKVKYFMDEFAHWNKDV